MLNTGYISFITETGGGKDAEGNPLQPTKTPSSFYECSLRTVAKQYLTYIDGQYLQAKYSAIADASVVGEVDIADLKDVELRDSQGASLGIFQVHRKEYLNFTDKFKIVV